jgi:Tfp pilus assembly pilus retraction ATPase PilT
MKLIEPNHAHPAAGILQNLVANMVHWHATDLHLRRNRPVMARVKGALQVASRWNQLTDEKGVPLASFDFNAARTALLQGTDRGVTVVYRLKEKYQVRVQILKDDREEKLLLRLQPRTPPRLESVLAANPKTLDLIANAKGLILVSGPAGSGKTTLAASMADYLACLHRHIITLEDPVEYYLDPENGEVSQFTCRMMQEEPLGRLTELPQNGNRSLGVPDEFIRHTAKSAGSHELSVPTELSTDLNHGRADTTRKITSLDAHIPDILRGDMDALYIGETRTPAALKACLTFAGSHEPVITTFQAGGIADALARLIVSAGEVVGQETARLLIAQCLQAIFYVNLAFTEAGTPVPVITCLPIAGISLRKIISENSPLLLANQIDQQLKDGATGTGLINRSMAMSRARSAGVPQESIETALPFEGRV